MSVGSRYNATTGDSSIILNFMFTIDGIPQDASSYENVRIYNDYDDAVANNTNYIEEVLPPNIVDTGDGTVEYEINQIIEQNTYFDRIQLIPLAGYSAIVFISAFYVRSQDFGGAPSELPQRCQVSGYIYDSNAVPVTDAIVSFKLIQSGEVGNDYLIIPDEKKFVVTNQVGFFSISLIRSTEFNPDIKYEIDIRYGAYREAFEKTVPNLAGANFNDLE